jgi:hypothetical protein
MRMGEHATRQPFGRQARDDDPDRRRPLPVTDVFNKVLQMTEFGLSFVIACRFGPEERAEQVSTVRESVTVLALASNDGSVATSDVIVHSKLSPYVVRRALAYLEESGELQAATEGARGTAFDLVVPPAPQLDAVRSALRRLWAQSRTQTTVLRDVASETRLYQRVTVRALRELERLDETVVEWDAEPIRIRRGTAFNRR